MKAAGGPKRDGGRRWWPWIAINVGYAAMLVVAAVVPTNPAGGLGLSGFAAHAAAYGVQALLLFGMIVSRLGLRAAATVAVFGAIGFGAFTELLQRMQPARSVDPVDIVADSIGAVVAMLGILVVRRVLHRGTMAP